MKLFIKNMVCRRCAAVVEQELKKLGLIYIAISLGEIETLDNITLQQRAELKTALALNGLELMDDKKAILIERIKIAVIEMVYYAKEAPKTNFSNYLGKKLNHNYIYLSNIFSETEHVTIEHFMLVHKIERVKELLSYNELNLTEIAWNMHYASVAHLSRQFKKIAGSTPSFFKSLELKKRCNIDNL